MSSPDIPAKFWTEFSAGVNTKEILSLMIPIYDKYLSHNDIKAMIHFYQSPAGKRLITAQPKIAQESMMVGQQWGERIAGPPTKYSIHPEESTTFKACGPAHARSLDPFREGSLSFPQWGGATDVEHYKNTRPGVYSTKYEYKYREPGPGIVIGRSGYLASQRDSRDCHHDPRFRALLFFRFCHCLCVGIPRGILSELRFDHRYADILRSAFAGLYRAPFCALDI